MRNGMLAPFAHAARTAADHGACQTLEWKSATCSVMHLREFVAPRTCERIVATATRFPDEPGMMQSGYEQKRRNRVRWIAHGRKTLWLFDIVERLFLEANRLYRFDIAGFVEPLQFVDYGPSGHIDWHLDCTQRETSTRKLVATIQLSSPRSFRGGHLEFSAQSKRAPAAGLGSATVFPAFLSHRVTPVTSGRRKVLVAWAHGPSFR